MVKLRGLLLAGLFALLASCDLLTMNIMPTHLSRSQGVVSLSEILSGVGLGRSYHIGSMRFLKVGGREIIALIAIAPPSGPRLVLLNGTDLSLIRSYDNPEIGNVTLVDMDGYLVNGRGGSEGVLRIHPNTLAAWPFTLVEPFGPGAVGFSVGGMSNLVWDNGANLLGYVRYLPMWTLSDGDTKSIATSEPHLGLRFRDLLYDDGRVRLLLSSSGGSSGQVLTFPSLQAFSNALTDSGPALIGFPGLTLAPLPLGFHQQGWLVPGAAIVLRHDNELRLSRYDADSGRELDSFVLRGFEDVRISFSPDGTRWLLYDVRSGKLHLLRAWW